MRRFLLFKGYDDTFPFNMNIKSRPHINWSTKDAGIKNKIQLKSKLQLFKNHLYWVLKCAFCLHVKYGYGGFLGNHTIQMTNPWDKKPKVCTVSLLVPNPNCSRKLSALGEDLLVFRQLQGFQIGIELCGFPAPLQAK